MSDIGLTGVPTTALNKVGGMGEIQPFPTMICILYYKYHLYI